MIRAAALLVAASMLGGCITLLPEPPPPPRTYVLEARGVQASQGAPVNAVIAVAQPTGERSILAADLIWRTGDTIAYVDQSQWSARAADALQQVLAETLMRQGRFTSSTRSGEARADYEIRWEVLDFEVREDDMQAYFRADVRLVAPGRRIIASQMIEAMAPVGARSSSVAAEALARAAGEGSARIGEFAADAVLTAQASASTGSN